MTIENTTDTDSGCQPCDGGLGEGAPLVAVIVLGFNDSSWLQKCLATLLATDYPDMIPIFVDNASSDDSVKLVRSSFPEVHIVESKRNLGYAGGNNLGIRHAVALGVDYFVLLNSDTRVDRDWLRHILNVFQDDSQVGVVTASIRNYDDDTLDHGYKQILSATPEFIQDAMSGKISGWYETTTGSGAALAFSREYLKKVGAIDPVFFMYYEEIDWLRRGRLHGLKLAVSTLGIVHHFNHLIDPQQRKPTKIRFERGHMIFTLKNQFEPMLKSIAKFLLEGPSRVVGALFSRQWNRAYRLFVITVELFFRAPSILRRRHLEVHAPAQLPEMTWLHECNEPSENSIVQS